MRTRPHARRRAGAIQGRPTPARRQPTTVSPLKLAGRAATLLIAVSALLVGTHSSAWGHEGEDEPVPADAGDGLKPVYEVPAGADRIIGSPDPGPDPQHSGDRGGSLQFATLGTVAAAVVFIMWRIARSARRASRQTA